MMPEEVEQKEEQVEPKENKEEIEKIAEEAVEEPKAEPVYLHGQAFNLTPEQKQAILDKGYAAYMEEEKEKVTQEDGKLEDDTKGEETLEQRLERIEKELKQQKEKEKEQVVISQHAQILNSLSEKDPVISKLKTAPAIARELAMSLVNRKASPDIAQAFNTSAKALEGLKKEIIQQYVEQKSSDADNTLGEGSGGESLGLESQPATKDDLMSGKLKRRVAQRIRLAERS